MSSVMFQRQTNDKQTKQGNIKERKRKRHMLFVNPVR